MARMTRMTSSYAGFKPRPRPAISGREPSDETLGRLKGYAAAAEASIAEPFKGITADGHTVRGLFAIEKTGLPTRPIAAAATEFLASLGENSAVARFPIDSDVWRRWSNIHPYVMRHGAALDAMSAVQREQALALLRESLSDAGFTLARDIMRLNETIREITGKDEEYGEWLYWLSIMGTPSFEGDGENGDEGQPWGWQIDGHHLIINCLVVGDQVVMAPVFMGSEPVLAEGGKYAGTRVFAAEEEGGLMLMQALTAEQRAKATLSPELPSEVFTTAYRDNFEIRYEGIRFDELSSAQQRLLLTLVETYVGRMRPGHARVKLEEVKRHLAQTYFAWMGGLSEGPLSADRKEDDSVFYYRVHSSVILIEFDHESGIALDNDAPSRNHIHTVVRTPNGNDYGKDLLRQHHEQVRH